MFLPLFFFCFFFLNPAADSEAEDGQETDGRGRGGDRAAGARQEEAAERTGRADRGQRAAPRPAERAEERDEVTTHLLPPSPRAVCAPSHRLTPFLFIRRRRKKSPPLIRVAEDDAQALDEFGSD